MVIWLKRLKKGHLETRERRPSAWIGTRSKVTHSASWGGAGAKWPSLPSMRTTLSRVSLSSMAMDPRANRPIHGASGYTRMFRSRSGYTFGIRFAVSRIKGTNFRALGFGQSPPPRQFTSPTSGWDERGREGAATEKALR